MESPVRIENRAQLIYLLTEAAEIEHGVMCCYMFAAFSMKKSVDEGITAEQVEIIKRWRGVIMQVAIQEMVHMCLACNLLTSIGAAPHVRRPNLPSSHRAYGPGFSLEFTPFDRDTMATFVFIERPESQESEFTQGENTSLPSLSSGNFSDIFSSERNYQTIGHLYRGVEDGFRYLTQKYGEKGLFIGPAKSQIIDRYFSLPGLSPVYDLETAITAIEAIVEQGEGARIEDENSHYARFVELLAEYDEILKKDPSFEPGRKVLKNPYSIYPNDVQDSEGVSLIEDPVTMDVCNLFDGCYEVLIQMMGRLLLGSEESEDQLTEIADITVAFMSDVILSLGDVLTTLPAGPSYPGQTAGPSFRFSRDGQAPPHMDAARALFVERMKELSSYCGLIQAEPELKTVLNQVRATLAQYADRLDKWEQTVA